MRFLKGVDGSVVIPPSSPMSSFFCSSEIFKPNKKRSFMDGFFFLLFLHLLFDLNLFKTSFCGGGVASKEVFVGIQRLERHPVPFSPGLQREKSMAIPCHSHVPVSILSRLCCQRLQI